MSEDSQVSLDEVRAFLRGEQVAARPPSDGGPQKPPPVDRVEVPLEGLGEEAENPGPQAYDSSRNHAEEPRINTGDPGPHTDPDLPTLRSEISWTLEDPRIGEIEVSEEEKALYLKAALNDVRVELPVQLAGGLTVVCRALSNYECEVTFRAIQMAQDEGLITSPQQQFSYLQWYNVCQQVVAVQGKHLNPLTFNSHSDDMDESAKKLRERYRELYRDVNAVRWAIMLNACRVFEIKLKICNDNLANLDFWQPAGGA